MLTHQAALSRTQMCSSLPITIGHFQRSLIVPMRQSEGSQADHPPSLGEILLCLFPEILLHYFQL